MRHVALGPRPGFIFACIFGLRRCVHELVIRACRLIWYLLTRRGAARKTGKLRCRGIPSYPEIARLSELGNTMVWLVLPTTQVMPPPPIPQRCAPQSHAKCPLSLGLRPSAEASLADPPPHPEAVPAALRVSAAEHPPAASEGEAARVVDSPSGRAVASAVPGADAPASATRRKFGAPARRCRRFVAREAEPHLKPSEPPGPRGRGR